jgi:hypothetical protein
MRTETYVHTHTHGRAHGHVHILHSRAQHPLRRMGHAEEHPMYNRIRAIAIGRTDLETQVHTPMHTVYMAT